MKIQFPKRGFERHEYVSRVKKAQKTLSVLNDYLKETLDLILLDIGSSSGIMTMEYAKQFKKVIGIDIDKRAIEFANKNNKTNNIEYLESPIEDSGLKDETIDVITCSHIYEHVPSDLVLVDEIYRLLKPGGICYLAAGNKYNIVEAHYKLPFLSYFPKKVADAYIRLFTDEKDYLYYNNPMIKVMQDRRIFILIKVNVVMVHILIALNA